MQDFLLSQDVEVKKSWSEGEDVYIEGWLAPLRKDRERDLIEPEAFSPVMDRYFQLNAPVSYRHNTLVLPAGHLQKAVILRDGVVIKTADHPVDKAEFTTLPTSDSGVYVRAVINAQEPATAIRKGNVAGFSFIGKGRGNKLPDGGRHITQLSEWVESTVAPYPVNQDAVFSICKAHGIDIPQEEKEPPMETPNIQELIAKALADQKEAELRKAQEAEELRKAQEAKANMVTKSDLAELVKSLQETFMAAVDEKLKKAEELNRGESSGRKGQNQQETPILDSLLQKSEKGEDFSREETNLINGLMFQSLVDGLQYYKGDK